MGIVPRSRGGAAAGGDPVSLLRAYPLTSLLAVVAVVVLERRWLRTGVFRSRAYWVSMAIVFGFMVVVDGWMTKLSAPLVIYDPDHISGVRFPWDIPSEEFLYAFAMITLSILLWERAGSRERDRYPSSR